MAASDFRLIVRPAQPHERQVIQAKTASGEPIASDACIVVYLDTRLLGWADDYGSFHLLPAPSSGGRIEEAAERFLEAAVGLWEMEAAS